MSKKDKPILVIPSDKLAYLFYGICIIVIFFIIYIIIAVRMQRIDYFSLFFNNIKNHIFLTVLTFTHVGFLGVGILTIIFAFFNLTPKVIVFKNRFEILLFLQKKKIVEFSKVKNIEVKIFHSANENVFLNKFKKECRVYFNNPVYNFYLAYPVKGYFDQSSMNIKKDRELLLRRCVTKRKNVSFLLNLFKKNYSIVKQYLPEENKN